MSTLLGIHIGSATVALVAGAAALTFKKGGNRHRLSGRIFLLTMVVMAVSAIPLAHTAGKTLDMLSGMLVCYLVITSWLTFQQSSKPIELGMMALGLVTVSGYLWVEWEAAQTGVRRPDVPAGAGYLFATITALAVLGDGARLMQASINRARQLVRHLWRMCFAFFMATVSFFLSRAQLFPNPVQDSGILYLLALAPIILMAFWWIRIRFGRRSSI